MCVETQILGLPRIPWSSSKSLSSSHYENGKKTIRWINKTICTCITLSCTFLSRRCTTTTWKCLISRFVEDVNTRQQLSFSFPGLWYCPLEFHSKKSCQHLTNYTRWNKRDKVWSSANFFFQWRFRSRGRCHCLSSPLLQHKHWTILLTHLNSVCLLGFGKTIWQF